jgi:hypothetical protein
MALQLGNSMAHASHVMNTHNSPPAKINGGQGMFIRMAAQCIGADMARRAPATGPSINITAGEPAHLLSQIIRGFPSKPSAK